MENSDKFVLVNYKGECYGEVYESQDDAQEEADLHNQHCRYDYYLSLDVELASWHES